MEKWHDGLPIFERNKLSKFKPTNDLLIKDLEDNEIVLAKATINKFIVYFLLIIDVILFIVSFKIYKENNNQTNFFFFLFFGISITILVYVFVLLQNYLLITNERLIGSLIDLNSNSQWSSVKILIPLRNVDNLVYDSGNQLKVISKSNSYSIFTNREDIESVKKIYYKYTQFKEKHETRNFEPDSINPSNNANINNKYNELEKLSEFLNKGIITQEEFDKKKKELLNL